MAPVITIDGPAASGKTSVSCLLAQRLGWPWLSTGAFYRGIAYIAQETSTSPHEAASLVEIIETENWKVLLADLRTEFLYRGEDVTQKIYQEDIGSMASFISRYPEVRTGLLQKQRQCAEGVVGLVAEGRDCGTVVFPEADVKFYLTAHSQSRAKRRALEQGADFQQTAEAQKVRDAQDSQRSVAPLKIPEEALVVDTSEMNLEQVVESLVNSLPRELVKPRLK